MDQRQVFSQMQTLMTFGDNNDNELGGLVIGSAVLTELLLARIIFLEGDKIVAALAASDANFDADELRIVDEAVAEVLDKVCCIKKQVVKEIELGIELRNGNGNGYGNGPGKGHGHGNGKA